MLALRLFIAAVLVAAAGPALADGGVTPDAAVVAVASAPADAAPVLSMESPPLAAPTPVAPVVDLPAPVASWVRAHAATIAWVLGLWVLLASAVNHRWPRPAEPAWKRWVHLLLIDLPAFLPSIDMRGIFGLPIAIPFLSLSKPADVAAAPPPVGLFLAGLLGASLLPGCAADVDAGRWVLAVMGGAIVAVGLWRSLRRLRAFTWALVVLAVLVPSTARAEDPPPPLAPTRAPVLAPQATAAPSPVVAGSATTPAAQAAKPQLDLAALPDCITQQAATGALLCITGKAPQPTDAKTFWITWGTSVGGSLLTAGVAWLTNHYALNPDPVGK